MDKAFWFMYPNVRNYKSERLDYCIFWCFWSIIA